MMKSQTRRIGTIGMAIAAVLLLSACLLSPGKFTSNLDLRRDGRFGFTYQGEIYLLALSRLAEMGAAANKKDFEASPCYDDDLNERKCTAEETARQKDDWEAEQQASAEKSKRDSEAMKAMLGGIDPADPKAAEELADRLRRQAGWKTVAYKGDGMFEVDFAIAGRIDHDFIFPTFERFSMANAFVQVSRRNDGTVRVDAPGFSPGTGGSPFGQMMQMGMAMGGKPEGKDDGEGASPKFPVLDGEFSVTTDGSILANNTDEGPAKVASGQRLAWKVNTRTVAAPMALVRLGD